MTRLARLGLAWRLMRRELRGGVRGFRVFLACLALGVAALATVGTVSAELLAGLDRDAKALLGGEAELRLFNRAVGEEERAWLRANAARLSETAELRAMARAETGERRLVELKAVDGAYPLHGALQLDPPITKAAALGSVEGLPGVIVEADLLARLGIALGDRVAIGAGSFEVRATLVREPDRAARAFTLGPRAMIGLESLAATGLDGPGSLVYRHVRLDLPAGEGFAAWEERLRAAFPEAGWRVNGLDRAAPGLARFVERVRLFMTLVGLTALLVGGVGVANAVRAHLEGRRDSIATLKCLGATGGLVTSVYLLQVLVLATLGTAIGLAVGALGPSLLAPLLAERLNLTLGGAPALAPLLVAGTLGLGTALLFALPPLARAQGLPAAGLFRGHLETRRPRRPAWLWPALALLGGGIAALVVLGAQDRLFALGFLAGAVVILLSFRAAAAGLIWLARRLPRLRRTSWRLALGNLHRPGAPTASVVVSLGLGLTVLAAVALIQANLDRQVAEEIPANAPTFYFLDIQNEQAVAYDALVAGFPGVTEATRVPMLRGRISAVNGQRPEEMAVPPEVAWVFQSDRGMTWAATQPEGVTLSAGQWWPADYRGEPLVSLDKAVGDALDLELGDTVTVNVYGRDVTASIASFRPIEWAELRINFVMIFSPGLLETAPASHLATVRIDAANEAALERAVTDAWPNVSAVRVRDALASFGEMLESVAAAIGGTGGVTILAGLLVLAGAVAAGERRRRYDAVVLKVLGATRRLLVGSLLIEFALLGLATAAIAALLGSLAAALVLELLMETPFALLGPPLLWTLAAGLIVTTLFGLLGTWRALGGKAAPLLRNE
jgi:putative ABC transport system permease protein